MISQTNSPDSRVISLSAELFTSPSREVRGQNRAATPATAATQKVV
ncbi:hypothetical protein [Arthrobacter psychrochitiniphilus]